MNTLVLPLPDRPRFPGDPASAPLSGFDWLLLGDDGQLLAEGHDEPSALPKSHQTALLLPERAVSWHRITLPRTNAQRWRAALAGLLEEHLLEDPDTLHLAVEATARGGEATWVAVTSKAPLVDALTRLENAQRLVDRIVPRGVPPAPTAPAQAWFFTDSTGPQLRWSDAQGVLALPLQGGLARTRLPQTSLDAAEWLACPDTLQAAETWLGRSVAVSSRAQQAARALASPWNVRQFDLSPRLRGLHWVRQLLHRGLQPQWRAARIGLVLWLGLAVVGLNATAWHQRQQLAQRQTQMEAALKSAFPRVGYVLEPRMQMHKELAALRARAGELGDQDLETLLAVLSLAWPPGRPPLEALGFDNGHLSWPSAGWSPEQVEELGRVLASEGWQLSQDSGRLTLRRGTR